MKQRNRIESFYDELTEELSDDEIAAGLTNGDISKPEWLCISEDTDHIKIWDKETGCKNWGFIQIDYS